MRTIIKKEALQCAMEGTAKELGRYAINGILVDAEHGLVSTDGRVMLIVPHQAGVIEEDFPEMDQGEAPGGTEPFLMPCEMAKSILGNLPKRRQTTRPVLGNALLDIDESANAVARTTDLEQTKEVKGKAMDATFPQHWQGVVPIPEESDRPWTMGVEVLEKVLKAAKKAKANQIVWRLKPQGEDADLDGGPAFFSFAGDGPIEVEGVYGLVMPVSGTALDASPHGHSGEVVWKVPCECKEPKAEPDDGDIEADAVEIVASGATCECGAPGGEHLPLCNAREVEG